MKITMKARDENENYNDNEHCNENENYNDNEHCNESA